MQGWVLGKNGWKVEMVIVIVMVSRNAAGVSGPGRECERKGTRRKCALLASKDGALIRSTDVEDRRRGSLRLPFLPWAAHGASWARVKRRPGPASRRVGQQFH